MDALEKVILPDTIEYVGSQCFYDCPNLTEVYIGENTEMDIKPCTLRLLQKILQR